LDDQDTVKAAKSVSSPNLHCVRFCEHFCVNCCWSICVRLFSCIMCAWWGEHG